MQFIYHNQKKILNLVLSLLALGGVLFISIRGSGALPPLGSTFNPGTGIWTTAQDARLPDNQILPLAGLDKEVQIRYESNGTAHIQAQTTHDLFMSIGYLHAKNRLFQMDLMRRQGEGLLSEVTGASALSSDQFELQLGLLRSAQLEWQQTPATDPARQVIIAYTQGVNAVIAQNEQQGTLPLLFKLLNYQPAPWTPVDTLVIQRVLTQTLTFTSGPLEYNVLIHSLGYQRTMQWFPILAANEQHPYDSGPYQQHSPIPLPIQQQTASSAGMQSTIAALSELQALPPAAIHHESNSNNWVVDGTKTASGKPLMAGDPHLDQTLPSIWYQIEASSPQYQFAGVSVPGLPIILIGHNTTISWSITNTQNQSTLYYQEKTSSDHPHQYYWNHMWRPTQQIHYTIPVKNSPPIPFTVETTVHGPIITKAGQTMSVWWAGHCNLQTWMPC
ncbi:penicillin acylase family protein [Dictyobacter kobayashii]|uniref:Penicillin acylase family protein n=1 Tax=Dictyobacter kobayashii TaxID=2014872 RepID=A0A402ASS1_9CHLR|nr:penicillin acylase family protein [Dictyobacter kobayashii]GCE22093.1 hypothetical protein KDK_58930 [Dictyobacter kobayashii]